MKETVAKLALRQRMSIKCLDSGVHQEQHSFPPDASVSCDVDPLGIH